LFTPFSLAVVIACAMAWTAFDLGRKLLVEKVQPLPLIFALTLGQAPLFAALGVVRGWGEVGPGYLLPALGSMLLNAVANVAFIYAFKLSPISVTVPLLSLTPVFTALFAVPLLGEVPTALQGAGILLVVAGALLLNRARGDGLSPGALWRAFRREPGALLMVVVAICWSITPAFDKLALAHASIAFHGTVLTTGVAALIVVLLAAQRRVGALAELRRSPGLFLAALLASVAALGLQLMAIRLVWVSLVETVKRGLGNVAALLLGHWMFDETITRGRIWAVVLMGVGVGLVVL